MVRCRQSTEIHPVKKGKVTILAKPSETATEGTYLSILRQAGLSK
jgi:predicted RNA binding protein YcfA (HicA-like mRNA interferase family)